MSLSIEVEVAGVADVLRELGRIDPELRKAAVATIKGALEPMAAAARVYVPGDPPLSGMARGRRMAWRTGRVRSGIRATVSVKADRSGRIPLARIVQKDAAGAMWDMAGKASGGVTPAGRRMVAVMTQRNGAPSRAMWRPVAAYTSLTEESLRDAVAEVERVLNNELGRG